MLGHRLIHWVARIGLSANAGAIVLVVVCAFVVDVSAVHAQMTRPSVSAPVNPSYSTTEDFLAAMIRYPTHMPRVRTDSTVKDLSGNPVCHEVSQEKPTDEFVSFNPNAGVLYPGALVQFGSLAGGTLSDVPVDYRKPLTVFITNAVPVGPGMHGPPPIAHAIVVSPTASSIDSARIEMLRQPFSVPPIFLWTATRAYSLGQALFAEGISASWMGASLRGALQSTKYSSRQNYLIRLTQPLYTYTVAPPAQVTEWFRMPWLGHFGGVTIPELTPYADPETNPIVFVRSVTYGRMALLSISSTEDSGTVAKSVNAAFGWATGGIETQLGASERSVIQNSEIRLWVYGGGWPSDEMRANMLGAPLESADKVAELASFLRPSGRSDVKWGVPISYRADYIASHRMAVTQLATKFTLCDAPVIPAVPVTLKAATIVFHTNGDNKDHDTFYDVSFVNGSDNVASATDRRDKEFRDHTDEPVELHVNHPFFKRDLTDPRIVMRVVQRNGGDRWIFSMTAHLVWSDDTTDDLSTGGFDNNDFNYYGGPAHH